MALVESGSSVFCIKIRSSAFNTFIRGGCSVMPTRFKLPYRAPRDELHGLQAATKLSSEFTPACPIGQRSISVR